jgi:putative ABC transport system permease protein
MASIARRNLFEDKSRFLVAQAGILFAVSLVTIQLGILKGFTRSTALMVDHTRADLWIASKEMVNLELTSPLPADFLAQADATDGVARAEVLLIRSALWRDEQGNLSSVRIYGFNPDGQLFARFPADPGNIQALKQPYVVLVDKANLKSLDLDKVGDRGRIGQLPAQVVGLVADTRSIASSPAIFTSLENATAYSNAELNSSVTCVAKPGGAGLDCTNQFQTGAKLAPGPVPPPRRLNLGDPITYILIQAKPGQDLGQLRQRLESRLPGTRVYTKAEMAQKTRDYWQDRTGVGFILGLGAAVGFIVGMVIVGQILYSSVADHIREFGTLKAMGAANRVIYGVIIEQALWMAVLGYIPSMGLCLGLSAWTLSAKGIVILIEPMTAAGVFGLTLVMCVGSALFAVQKVIRVDPAIVFKA